MLACRGAAKYPTGDTKSDPHGGRHGFSQIGEFFAYYKTTFSRSRENFLKILVQGKQGYVINEAMIWHLFQCGINDDILYLFEEYQGKVYTSAQGLTRLLNSLGIENKKLRKSMARHDQRSMLKLQEKFSAMTS